MTTKHYRKENGDYIGVFADGAKPPKGAVECAAPDNGNAKWANDKWEIGIEKSSVDNEREKRMDQGLLFNGNIYDFDLWSQVNIGFMAIGAKRAIDKGAKVGDYRWANPLADFQWITKDNKRIKMDAHDMSAFGDAATLLKTKLVFKSRDLKDMEKIPQDFDDDKHW